MGADSYWARRSIEREEEWNKKSRETIEKELASQYERSAIRIQGNIEKLYGKFARDNGLSKEEARKLITGTEYRTWRKDIEEYVKEYKETGNPKTLLELNTLAMRSRISRLDKLYSETLIELDKLGQHADRAVTKFLKDAYKDNRLHSAYELAKRGNGPLQVAVDSKRMQDVLRTPWSGKNYSERIWKNSDKLAKTIQDTIVNGVHRGVSVNTLAKEVQKRMEVGKSDAVRLVRTELNYIHNQATLDSLREAKMGYFQFIATLDKRTSSVCRNHDNNVYPLDEAEVGSNVPPLHPRCRSTIAGALGPKKGTGGSRTVKVEPSKKGGTVKYTKVPRNMAYDDWKAVYVDKSKTFDEWRTEQKANKPTKEALSDKPTKEITSDMIRKKMSNIDLSKANPQDIINLGKMVVEKHSIVDIIGDKEALKKVFSEYREMGSIVPKEMWAKYGNKQNQTMLQEAFSYYPADWLQYVRDDNCKICAHKVNRGYFHYGTPNGRVDFIKGKYDSDSNYITIAMNGVKKTTPYHEIGHMVEHFNKDALRLSLEYRNVRVQGEHLQYLSELLNYRGYGRELTYADNFINPYIGKDYGEHASEILSMGLESVFSPNENGHVKKFNYKTNSYEYATISDDIEYLHFIVGMILKA